MRKNIIGTLLLLPGTAIIINLMVQYQVIAQIAGGFLAFFLFGLGLTILFEDT